MSKSIYGYVRVSTKEQNLDRQLIAMREYGVPQENIFVDKQSGKDFERPSYQRMMKEISSGGVLVIKSIDRLGRSYDETIEEWRRITREKPIDQPAGCKGKKFCSDACRIRWWNHHTNLMKANAVCTHCGKSFHGRAGRKYCSHACYIAERFGEAHVS